VEDAPGGRDRDVGCGVIRAVARLDARHGAEVVREVGAHSVVPWRIAAVLRRRVPRELVLGPGAELRAGDLVRRRPAPANGVVAVTRHAVAVDVTVGAVGRAVRVVGRAVARVDPAVEVGVRLTLVRHPVPVAVGRRALAREGVHRARRRSEIIVSPGPDHHRVAADRDVEAETVLGGTRSRSPSGYRSSTVGSGDRDLSRFLTIAMGSARELEYHLLLASLIRKLNAES
jgi:hypothetical protein